MAWICPECGAENDDSLQRCLCGYEDIVETMPSEGQKSVERAAAASSGTSELDEENKRRIEAELKAELEADSKRVEKKRLLKLILFFLKLGAGLVCFFGITYLLARFVFPQYDPLVGIGSYAGFIGVWLILVSVLVYVFAFFTVAFYTAFGVAAVLSVFYLSFILGHHSSVTAEQGLLAVAATMMVTMALIFLAMVVLPGILAGIAFYTHYR